MHLSFPIAAVKPQEVFFLLSYSLSGKTRGGPVTDFGFCSDFTRKEGLSVGPGFSLSDLSHTKGSVSLLSTVFCHSFNSFCGNLSFGTFV